MRTIRTAAWVLSGLAACGWSAAALPEDLRAARACAAVSDAGARLACYDSAFARAPSATSTPPAPPPAATPPPVEFGDNGQLAQEVRAKAKLPKKIDAKIVTATELHGGLYRLTLDNAQVWVTHEASPSLQFVAGNSVTVTRMALGGYQISFLGSGTSVGAQRLQ